MRTRVDLDKMKEQLLALVKGEFRELDADLCRDLLDIQAETMALTSVEQQHRLESRISEGKK